MTTSQRAGFVGGLLILFTIPLIANAAVFRTGEQPSFPAGEAIADDLYMAGGNVTSSGALTGDLIIGGGSVLINGPVSADVLASGGQITMMSDIAGDVRAAGGNILISGAVFGDVILGGGQITLTGSQIGGDVAIGGGSVRIDAPVTGDIRIGGGDIYINAPVAGNVRIDAEKVTLGPKANIAGNLIYSAAQPVVMEQGAVVTGAATFNERKASNATKAGLAAVFSVWLLAKLLMSLAGAFAIGLLLHRFSKELVATAAMQPLAELARGVIIMIVLPILSVILLVTVIGIPFGVLGLLSFGALMIFSSLAAPIVAGSIIHKWIWKQAGYVVDWKSILIGVGVYFVLGLVPFIGGLVKAGIMLLTLGAAMNIKWNVIKEWR